MHKTKLRVSATLAVSCIEFFQRKLDRFDTSRLEYFRLYARAGQSKRTGTWGRCTFPNNTKELGYRIRCCVSLAPGNLPYPVKHAIGTRRIDEKQWEWAWRKARYSTLEEAFVWLCGREAFHWLRHSRQIPGQNYEPQANRYGFAWLDEWRELANRAGTGSVTGAEAL